MDELLRKVWQKEINREYTRRLEFMVHMPPSPSVPWWKAQWERLLWRVSQAREWLGEKIAGRRFGDDY